MEQRFRLSKTIELNELNWTGSENALTERYGLRARDAKRICKRFQKRLRRSFELSWFDRKPGRADSRMIELLCELNSCDELHIRHRYSQLLSLLPVSGENRICLSLPASGKSPSCSAEYSVSVLGRKFEVHRLGQLILAHAVVFLLAVLAYILIAGVLLYGLSVLAVLLMHPNEMTQAMLYKPQFILALSALGVIAILSCKVFTRLWRSRKAKAG